MIWFLFSVAGIGSWKQIDCHLAGVQTGHPMSLLAITCTQGLHKVVKESQGIFTILCTYVFLLWNPNVHDGNLWKMSIASLMNYGGTSEYIERYKGFTWCSEEPASVVCRIYFHVVADIWYILLLL